jgi:hypothetical protein
MLAFADFFKEEIDMLDVNREAIQNGWEQNAVKCYQCCAATHAIMLE